MYILWNGIPRILSNTQTMYTNNNKKSTKTSTSTSTSTIWRRKRNMAKIKPVVTLNEFSRSSCTSSIGSVKFSLEKLSFCFVHLCYRYFFLLHIHRYQYFSNPLQKQNNKKPNRKKQNLYKFSFWFECFFLTFITVFVATSYVHTIFFFCVSIWIVVALWRVITKISLNRIHNIQHANRFSCWNVNIQKQKNKTSAK